LPSCNRVAETLAAAKAALSAGDRGAPPVEDEEAGLPGEDQQGAPREAEAEPPQEEADSTGTDCTSEC